MLKIIAVRYVESRIVNIEEYTSVVNALGIVETENHELRNVGYGPEWSVYLVEDGNWFLLTNYVNSGVRWDFMQFLRSVGGKYAGFDVENFEAPDREDF